eukprot:2585866-Prymnesium_polylepis.2
MRFELCWRKRIVPSTCATTMRERKSEPVKKKVRDETSYLVAVATASAANPQTKAIAARLAKKTRRHVRCSGWRSSTLSREAFGPPTAARPEWRGARHAAGSKGAGLTLPRASSPDELANQLLDE